MRLVIESARPKFVMAVSINDPQSHDATGNLVYGGGAVAAPVFHRVMDGALRLMDVPPDNVQQWYAAAPNAAPNPLLETPLEVADFVPEPARG